MPTSANTSVNLDIAVVPPVKRFSSNLRDLLKNQMKVSIQEGRDRNGAYIQGVGLRCFYDPEGDKQRPLTMDDCDGFKKIVTDW
jgi:hypothetical protein